MPKLAKTLEGHDLGFLHIVADFWGIDLDAPNVAQGIQILTARLIDPGLVDEIVSGLPVESREGLIVLIRNKARMPWSLFDRRYGRVRVMGAGRRDREKPFINPNASSAEALWYRALVGRTFFDTPDGPLEYAYIPDDLLELLSIPLEKLTVPLGRPATPSERQIIIPANDRILDDACTLLAALRTGISLENIQDYFICGSEGAHLLSLDAMHQLLRDAGLLDQNGDPLPDPTRLFLELTRNEALAFLVNAWKRSNDFDELRMVPGIVAEGEWKNDPKRTREVVFELLAQIPGGDHTNFGLEDNQFRAKEIHSTHFWSLAAFVAAVKQISPDFQRPSGDYDSWFLRDEKKDEYLRGIENWDEVEGRLLRFFIAGPCHWLGLVDLGLLSGLGDVENIQVSAFRFSGLASYLLGGGVQAETASALFHAEDEQITVRSDGRIRVPICAPRAARYQIARFSEWQGVKDDFYRYRLTPASLKLANSVGLKTGHLIALLDRFAVSMPPNLLKAIKRWELHGVEASLERVDVLRCKDAAVIKELQKSNIARYLGEPLGQEAILIKPGKSFQVLAALADLGYLGEVLIDDVL